MASSNDSSESQSSSVRPSSPTNNITPDELLSALKQSSLALDAMVTHYQQLAAMCYRLVGVLVRQQRDPPGGAST
jgi:hypothetical protein